MLDGDQTYRMVVVKQNSEYQAEERELYVEPPTDDPEPQKEDVALSRVHFLVGELTAKELSAEEIADAGIDTEDPMNREVTEFTLVLVYQKEEPVTLPITYYVNGRGRHRGGRRLRLDSHRRPGLRICRERFFRRKEKAPIMWRESRRMLTIRLM